MIHGDAATQEAIRASEILFTGGAIGGLSETTFNEVVGEVPTRSFAAEGLSGSGRSLVELFVESGLCPSKGQARKDLEGGGLYLNNERITESSRMVTPADLLFGRHLLLRKGRRNYVVLSASTAG